MNFTKLADRIPITSPQTRQLGQIIVQTKASAYFDTIILNVCTYNEV